MNQEIRGLEIEISEIKDR